MPHIAIDSPDDPRLAAYRNLKRTNLTRWSGIFIAEGDKLVRRLLASDFETVSVVVAQSELDELTPRVPANVPLYVVGDAWVEHLVGFNFHRGILACGRRKPNPILEAVVPPAPSLCTLIVCPDVQDPENLGAILRIGAAFGASPIILGRRSADPWSRRVLRVSMGAALKLPIARCDDIDGALERLGREMNVELAATVLDKNAEPLDQAGRTDRFGLVLGSEGHGLEARWIERCDRRITIPMRPGTDSLNVAVAAGIFLHHFRQ
jgi:tRNA G18 (ribose-2'-O)-methylase SpoU